MCCTTGTCGFCLDTLRAELTGHAVGEGDVTFKRTDGHTFTVKNVRVDSVGPSADAPGVIAVEFFGSDDVLHVPFVESWTFDYEV